MLLSAASNLQMLLGDLLVDALALGEILVGGNEAAVIQWTIAYAEQLAAAHAPPDHEVALVGKRGLQIGDQFGDVEILGVGALLHHRAHQVGQMHAGLRLVRGKPVDFEVSAVADQEPHVAVVDAEPVRHVLERRIEQQVLLLELLLVAQALGHVLARGDPAAVAHRARDRLDDAAVAAGEKADAGLAAADFAHPASVDLLGRQARAVASRHPMLDHLPMRDAGLDDIGVEAVDANILLVADDQPLVGAEHREAMGHVPDRVFDAPRLQLQGNFQARAAGDVVAHGDPAAIGQRAQIERDDKAARQQLLGAERLSGSDHGETFAHHLVDVLRCDIADRRRVGEDIAIAEPRADRVRRHLEQIEIALVEQHDAVVGVINANALRGAFERDPAEREQLLSRPRVAGACPLVSARRHAGSGLYVSGGPISAKPRSYAGKLS